jgi:enoyl-CoA hydratase
MATPVTYRLDGSIATITMDDGKRNALSHEMFAGLNAALDRAAADGAAVILTGREGVFSAGFDLRTLMAGGADAARLVRTGFELGARLLGFARPVVVACSGHAIAMGSFLLLAGDYRLGVAGDFKVQANEVQIGITMPFFALEMCRQRLAPAHVHRAAINAEVYTPEGAVAAGFLDRLVAPADLAAAARDTAADLAGRLNADAFTATKLRAREASLRAVRAAIEADDAAWPR